MKSFAEFLTESTSISFIRSWFASTKKIDESKVGAASGKSFTVKAKFKQVSDVFESKYKKVSSGKNSENKSLVEEVFDVGGTKVKLSQHTIEDNQTSVILV